MQGHGCAGQRGQGLPSHSFQHRDTSVCREDTGQPRARAWNDAYVYPNSRDDPLGCQASDQTLEWLGAALETAKCVPLTPKGGISLPRADPPMQSYKP